MFSFLAFSVSNNSLFKNQLICKDNWSHWFIGNGDKSGTDDVGETFWLIEVLLLLLLLLIESVILLSLNGRISKQHVSLVRSPFEMSNKVGNPLEKCTALTKDKDPFKGKYLMNHFETIP